MKTLEQWFTEYSESHQNHQNQIIHKICVPLIFFSVVGLLLEIPYAVGPLRVGEIVIIGALCWYLTLGLKAFSIMVIQLGISYILLRALSQQAGAVYWLIGIFVTAWIGQFIGHKIEGKKPSFFKDLQYLLIGPLWVVSPLFSRRASPK